MSTGLNLCELRVERWPIERLVPFAHNPRTHTAEQIAQVAASILQFGWTNPILVGADSVIIAGHARLLAARKLGVTEVPVIALAHLSETQRRALVIADNQLALNAGWDEALLQAELRTIEEAGFDLELLGFGDQELSDLLGDPEEVAAGHTDEDAVPELQPEPVSAAGDLWLLGPHRLLCGDATAAADVNRLMAGESADLVFTDPPYNVDYQGYTEDHLTIQGDRMSAGAFRQFLTATFRCYRQVVKAGASLYVCHASSCQREFQNALESAEFTVRCQIIWAKNTFAWGFGRYKFQHEPIFYCHLAGQSDSWYGDKSQSTLWQEKKPAANRLHPTMKPIELIERALLNSSKAGDLVIDLFGGSGSTLIACERRGRKARLMEIDPKYVDCIVRRWQDYTAQQVVLDDKEGRTFEEIGNTRRRAAT